MKTELQKCLDGTSGYCHADAVKLVYETLNRRGNAEEFQLYVLQVIREGIEEDMRVRGLLISHLIEKGRREAEDDPCAGRLCDECSRADECTPANAFKAIEEG